ncbi:MAG: tRNA (adenosine(37)-N6)-threonylcarbamoyltransferase complex ATPase subunit type 1 TsaE [bacterium]
MAKRDISNLSDLQALVHDIAAELRGGEVLGLVGDLGTGKTTFTQLLAKELGVTVEVKSPTFVLVREYPTGSEVGERGINQLVHADAYRLEDESELWGIGFGDQAGEPSTVTVVEWADRVPGLQHLSGYRELRFSVGVDGRRLVDIN